MQPPKGFFFLIAFFFFVCLFVFVFVSVFVFFFKKLRQMLVCNYFYIFFASFDVYEVKFGVVVWVGGSLKIMVGGLVKSHDFYFVHFINMLQDICSKLAM